MLSILGAWNRSAVQGHSLQSTSHPLASGRAPADKGELRVGAVTRIGQHAFRITEKLGTGSFSTVWAATRVDGNGGEVAIKETLCRSPNELADAEYEMKIIQQIGSASNRIPEHLASETVSSAPGVNNVRFAMTKVPGESLGAFLNRWKPTHRVSTPNPQVVKNQLGEACFWTRELIAQLLPAFEAVAPWAVHRDVNTHNILVHTQAGDTSSPQFGLVDFGLAIESQTWANKLTQMAVVGDCRYWPVSAWYVFAAGGPALAQHPQMMMEYRTQLDIHCFGITALQMFVEMLPDPVAGSPGAAALPEEMRGLKRAWEQYWMDAYTFWEPLFKAFELKTDWNQLRQTYLTNNVHKTISKDLGNVRQALSKVCEACARADPGSRLSSYRPLFNALLKLISQGGKKLAGEAPDVTTWQSIRSILNITPGAGTSSSALSPWGTNTFASTGSSALSSWGTSTFAPTTTTTTASFMPPVLGTSSVPLVMATSTPAPCSYTTYTTPSAMVPAGIVAYVA